MFWAEADGPGQTRTLSSGDVPLRKAGAKIMSLSTAQKFAWSLAKNADDLRRAHPDG